MESEQGIWYPTDTEETCKARRNGFRDRSVVSVSHVERARAENAAEQMRKPAWVAGTMGLLEVRQTTGRIDSAFVDKLEEFWRVAGEGREMDVRNVPMNWDRVIKKVNDSGQLGWAAQSSLVRCRSVVGKEGRVVPGRYVLQRGLCGTEARNAGVVGSGRRGIGPGATVRRGRKLDRSVESQKRMWTTILS